MFLTTCSIFISASIFDQWCICEFLQDLQKRICRIRELYQSQVKEGKSKGRLVPDDEKLMWEVFRHHPYATEKLMGATYIQVGQSPKSNNPNDYAFFIMRNDEDGDDISYVKCLRCLAEAQHGKQNTEQVLSLASISLGKALQLDINGAAMVLADEPQGSVGIRVELEKRFLSLHSVSGIYGPYLLGGDPCSWSIREVFPFILKDTENKQIFTDSFWWSSTQETDLPGERSIAIISRSPRI